MLVYYVREFVHTCTLINPVFMHIRAGGRHAGGNGAILNLPGRRIDICVRDVRFVSAADGRSYVLSERPQV